VKALLKDHIERASNLSLVTLPDASVSTEIIRGPGGGLWVGVSPIARTGSLGIFARWFLRHDSSLAKRSLFTFVEQVPTIIDSRLVCWLWEIIPVHQRHWRPKESGNRQKRKQSERNDPDQNTDRCHDFQGRDDCFRPPCKNQDWERGQNDHNVEESRLANNAAQAWSRVLVNLAWNDHWLQRWRVHAYS
jgi:hypothetical protein